MLLFHKISISIVDSQSPKYFLECYVTGIYWAPILLPLIILGQPPSPSLLSIDLAAA